MNFDQLQKVTLKNGETYSYREAGSGDDILILLHGNMTSSKHWDVLVDKLYSDFKIIAPDLRGFGGSSYNMEISSLKDFSEDLKEFVDALNIKSFYLGGWSTGGGVAMQFSADYKEYVKKLILVESVGIQGYPILKKNELGQPIQGSLLKTKEEIAADPVQVAPVLQALKTKNKEFYRMVWNASIYTHNKPEPSKYEEYLEDMLTQRNLVDVDYALATFNISNNFNGITEGSGAVNSISCPVLIFQGDRDYVVPRYMGEGIKEKLPQSELVILNDCGHSPLVDCLETLSEKIKDFLNNN
ncbi:alpha/beta fold hydrolase [Alloiococcus sp. CFN-8]|uniref:intracellular short-chain-length polyhydroxyalkanoate depolymerase n=1 Tax=Alloiococcus sp. CFN-8 TaxID=3416081 RepID=UPI003CED440F